MSEPGWPKAHYSSTALDITVRAFRVFFALIYGAKLTPLALSRYEEHRYFGFEHLNSTGVEVVSTVCAYAQFYQCFDYIKPLIVEVMQSAPGYWGAVADDPWIHLELAKKLQLEDVYRDALRHLIYIAHRCGEESVHWQLVADELSSDVHRVRAFFVPQLERSKEKIPGLKIDLAKVQLSPVQAFYNEIYTAGTTFANVLQFLDPRRPVTRKAEEAAEFLARAMFGQWFAQQLHGEQVARAEKGRLRATKPRYVASFRFQKAPR